uniref:Uncharacterized protein n=1 Tax=Glossina pallidipes TaxID=7398 RepID=A0A1A9ZW10_GLOPL
MNMKLLTECKENVKSNLEQKFNTVIDDKNDIEKEETHNVNEASVSSNQCKTGISENYSWDEDGNDLFFSISTQEILDQGNFPSTSKRGHKFPANKEITQELQKAIEEHPELGEGKNKLEAVKNKMHQGVVGKVNNPVTSLVSAGFQTANGKNVLISEKARKRVEGLLNECHQSESNGDIENNLLYLKNEIISKKESMLASVSSFTSRNDGDYPSCSKLPADEKESNVKLECKQTDPGHSALNYPTMIRRNRFLSLNPKFNIRNQPEGLSTPKTIGNN